ncbi:unnamed protein product [Mucor hiemalis]
MFLEDPQNNEVYKTFLSSKDILDILVTRFGEEPFTARQIERMVNADGSWNEMKSRRVNGKMVEGRHLWVMLEGHLATFNVNIRDQYLKHLKTLVMKNIEYVRKSVTNESDKTRSRLLNKMTNTLREKNKCTTLFVSPKSNAGENIEERDKDVDLTLLENLKGCNGTTQDIINHLERKLQDTRLVVLDYAGLSTNAGDLRHFFG